MASMDITFEDRIPNQKIQQAFATTLDLQVDDVYVLHDGESMPSILKDREEYAICELVEYEIGFQQYASVTMKFSCEDDALDRRQIAKRLASILHTRCLIPGDSLCVLDFTLITPHGHVESVMVDQDAYDDRGWLVIHHGE